MSLIEVGSDAPDFESMTSTGNPFRLSDLRGNLRAMLVFYPTDFTSGCTAQLCEVRNNADLMREVGTEPIGVNPGDAETHEKFREEYGFNFDILVDEDRKIAESYGSIKEDGSGVLRSVIVVGRNGKVIYAQEGAPPWPVVSEELRSANDA
jgi:peroxiredoxin Q/BCP